MQLFHPDSGLDGVNLYMDLDSHIKEYRPDANLVMI